MNDSFWSKVDRKSDNDCWLWTGHNSIKDKKGYGRFILNGKRWDTHRLSYTLKNGEIPKNKLVLHNCDNPPCVNPSHLRLGTIQDNHKDMMLRRRYSHGKQHWVYLKPERLAKGKRNGAHTHPEKRPIGEKSGMAKLKLSQVKKIRKLYKYHSRKNNQFTLAKRYGVSQMAIWSIIKNKTWKN